MRGMKESVREGAAGAGGALDTTVEGWDIRGVTVTNPTAG